MTKKHFEALAAALKAHRIELSMDHEGMTGHADQISEDIANVCARFNPHFDRMRFLTACGVEESK